MDVLWHDEEDIPADSTLRLSPVYRHYLEPEYTLIQGYKSSSDSGSERPTSPRLSDSFNIPNEDAYMPRSGPPMWKVTFYIYSSPKSRLRSSRSSFLLSIRWLVACAVLFFLSYISICLLMTLLHFLP